jgi:hypothetical protein
VPAILGAGSARLFLEEHGGSEGGFEGQGKEVSRFVRWVTDPETAQRILGLASELEQQAMQPDEEDIRTRAYDLWKQAGEPEDRDKEFWLLAEQELRNENASSMLRTPDGLR